MEKLETTSTAFFYISKKLEEELVGGYINNLQEVELKFKEDKIDESVKGIKIKIHKKQTKELITTEKTLFLAKHKIPVLEKSKGISNFLKKKIYNQKIQEIKQDKNNRVIYFKLDQYYLIFEYFSNSNIILTDLDFIVITSKKQEFWKDRQIKAKRKYDFPSSIDIKEKDQKQLEKEIENKTKEEVIRYFVKTYNIYPWYLEEIFAKTEKIIPEIKKLYEYKNPIIKTIDHKDQKIIVVLENNQETEFFQEIENLYLYQETKTDEKKESKQMLKIKEILKHQIDTQKEYEEIMTTFQKEGEEIYSNFTLIDQINKQIQIARNKKIDITTIENKINEQLKKINPKISIKDIDLKNKTYKLKIEN